MNSNLFQMIYEDAKSWTIEAGQRLRESLQEELQIEYKTSAADLVTHKDRETEQFFIDKIVQKYPQHYILGEEGMTSDTNYKPQDEIVWIVDPIDGTTNFVHQKINFSISVAVYEKGEPRIGIIYDPMTGECFHSLHGHGAFLNDSKLQPLSPTTVEEALLGINSLWLTPNEKFDHEKLQSLVRHSRGTRSVGSAALEIAYVACGRFDGYITLRLSPWDFAAGLVMLEELGAITSTIHNQPIDIFKNSSLFVAKPGLHEEIMKDFLNASEAPRFSKKV